MNPLLREFISESREHVERSGGALATLEAAPGDAEAINALFRAAHTIKGSCRLFDLEPVTRLVSAIEDLLDAAREHEIALDRHHLDLLLQGFDALDGWFDELEKRGELAPGASAASLAAEIGRAAGRADQPEADAGLPRAAEGSWLGEVDEDLRADLLARHGDRTLVAVLYEPEADCFYAGEDPLYTVRSLSALVALEVTRTGDWPALLEFDVHRCMLRFHAFCSAPLAAVEPALMGLAGQVSVAEIDPARLAVATGPPQTLPEAEAAARAGLDRLNDGDLQGVLRALASLHPDPGGRLASSLRWIARLAGAPRINLAAIRSLLQAIVDGGAAAAAWSPSPEPQQGGEAAARKLLQAQKAMLAASADASLLPGRVRSAAAAAARCARQLQRQDLVPEFERAAAAESADAVVALIDRLLVPAAFPQPPPAPPPAERPRERATQQLRIDLAQLDRLMDLIGEMVVAKNGLPYLARQAEAQGLREFARGLKDRYGVIHRIVEEMQATISRVRLVPLSHAFRRLPRLVRDAARHVRKEVVLAMDGETVEADRRVVDALAEPLLHLVRNAVDHGLEPPDLRQAKGKPAAGQVRISARTEGDRLLLEVTDDGRGIDFEAVKRRAYERGLIGEEDLGTLSEDGALQLLFHAGFSTRGSVTDMSGRGVGLDVVRTGVEALGGAVSLSSRRDEGTRVVLAMPLSLATAEVMMVDAAGQSFGVPVAQVDQTLKLPRERVREVKRNRAFVLREKVVPLLAARQVLGLPAADGDGDLSVLVARLGGGLVGMEVDRFGDVAEVVMKPLDGVLAGMRQYAGSAVLADGSVLLVLDLPRLVADAARV